MNFLQNNVPQNLQKITGYLIVLLIFGLVLSSFAITLSYLAYAKNQSDQVSTRQINVSGEGKVAVKPDIATFTASVVTQAEKVRTAQEENAQRSNRIIEFTKAQGVAEKDLKT
ncbi:MAG: SIMPL domain-containing protein, partial [Candidatus Sungbacteria bacterium]|nr:SIMPL domain-containing protein [Candidatus Sungbacteria bacterium]